MPSLNIGAILRDRAAVHPDHPAVVAGDRILGYREVDDRARRLAAALHGAGVRPGEHVAVLFPNVPEFTIAYFGCHYAGCPVVPLNVLCTADELTYHLDDSDSVALIASEALAERAEAARSRAPKCRLLITAGSAAEGLPLDALIAGAEPVRDLAATRPNDTAVILYTSGTTGRPKGAELTHANLDWNARHMAEHFFVDGDRTVTLGVLPLFHSFGQTVIQNATLVSGGTMVLLPRFEPLAALEAIERRQVTLFAGVPTMYFGLLRHPEAERFSLRSLRRCISGGAPMPVEVLREFDRRHGVDVLEGYGLSETSPVASHNRPDRPRKVGSIGIPLLGVEFKLVDGEGRDVTEPGVRGEICIKGPIIMKGYYRRPEATAEAIQDGWFRTGDIAHRDEDGYYFIVDRKKDMLIRGGYNVYPREVEEVLYAHPAVAEAAVIGVPDERLGEEVMAVIALKRDAVASAEELIAHCRERMAPYKYPRSVSFVESLPKGPTGKILKRALRDAHAISRTGSRSIG